MVLCIFKFFYYALYFAFVFFVFQYSASFDELSITPFSELSRMGLALDLVAEHDGIGP